MTILLVDDEKQALDGILHGVDFDALGLDTVLTARSGEEARELIVRQRIDLLVTDIEMADLSGLELLEWIRDRQYPILTIFCTAFRNFDYAKKALELHAFDYFLKPIRYEELTEKLQSAIRSIGVIRQADDPAPKPAPQESAPPTKVRGVIQTVCKYIEENLASEITRSDLARLVYMNPDYLGTIFKEEIGCSITIYIQNLRLTRARQLLRETDLPISKVAEQVGYDNISYFSKLFRQKIGCQPGEYRKKGEVTD
jgi:YesN/AraC family two-component response regulator